MTKYRFVGQVSYVAVGYATFTAGPDGFVRGLERDPEAVKFLLERGLIAPAKPRKEEESDANLSTVESGPGD